MATTTPSNLPNLVMCRRPPDRDICHYNAFTQERGAGQPSRFSLVSSTSSVAACPTSRTSKVTLPNRVVVATRRTRGEVRAAARAALPETLAGPSSTKCHGPKSRRVEGATLRTCSPSTQRAGKKYVVSCHAVAWQSGAASSRQRGRKAGQGFALAAIVPRYSWLLTPYQLCVPVRLAGCGRASCAASSPGVQRCGSQGHKPLTAQSSASAVTRSIIA